MEEPAAESGFYKIQDCDIPFAEEEQSVAEENEYANAQDDRITEGGMPPDREEEETVSEGFTKEVPEDDISASDLFKILG